MRIDKPSSPMKSQGQTSTPLVQDDTLVDDPVALVDSTTSVVGGATTSLPVMRVMIVKDAPKPRIKIYR